MQNRFRKKYSLVLSIIIVAVVAFVVEQQWIKSFHNGILMHSKVDYFSQNAIGSLPVEIINELQENSCFPSERSSNNMNKSLYIVELLVNGKQKDHGGRTIEHIPETHFTDLPQSPNEIFEVSNIQLFSRQLFSQDSTKSSLDKVQPLRMSHPRTVFQNKL